MTDTIVGWERVHIRYSARFCTVFDDFQILIRPMLVVSVCLLLGLVELTPSMP